MRDCLPYERSGFACGGWRAANLAPETQIARVLAAYREGSRTTPEVHAITGLPIKHCSTHTRALVAKGKLSDLGERDMGNPGRKCHWYEPVNEPLAQGGRLAAAAGKS